MATVVKSESIIRRTFELIQNQGFLLLRIDGEDPLSDDLALVLYSSAPKSS